MKKSLALLIMLCGLLAGLGAQTTVTIGTGHETETQTPMECFWGYTYTQTIYKQSEIIQPMTINKIAYEYSGASWTGGPVDIFIGHTTKNGFAAGWDWVPVDQMTHVFSGAVTIANGWAEISLNTPFDYNGIDNLVIAFDANLGTVGSVSNKFYTTNSPGNGRTIRHRSDIDESDPANPPSNGSAATWTVFANIKLIESAATTPVFKALPLLKNFDEVQIGTISAEQTFTIKNSGVGTLNITGLNLTGSDADQFVLTDGNSYPVALNAGENITVKAKFTPSTLEAKSAVITVVSDAKVNHEIALSGTGVDCAITTFPYTEDFEEFSFYADGWSRSIGLLENISTMTPTTDNCWKRDKFANNYAADNYGVKVNIYGTNTQYWLITPPLNLGSEPTTLNIKFDASMTKYDEDTAPDQNGTDDKFAVVISRDNGVTWSSANVLRQYDNVSSQYSLNSFSTTATAVSMDVAGLSGFVKIGFYGESTVANADNELHLDNFTIEKSSAIGNALTLEKMTLSQNYPNPFNPTTSINFYNNMTGNVKLTVMNAKGETVTTLINNNVVAGNHKVNFDGSQFNSGVYFYKLETPNSTITKKMLLIK